MDGWLVKNYMAFCCKESGKEPIEAHTMDKLLVVQDVIETVIALKNAVNGVDKTRLPKKLNPDFFLGMDLALDLVLQFFKNSEIYDKIILKQLGATKKCYRFVVFYNFNEIGRIHRSKCNKKEVWKIMGDKDQVFQNRQEAINACIEQKGAIGSGEPL
jgi:hypothetical protein